jgi:hypothetical protein
LIVDAKVLEPLTNEFIALKHRFFPVLTSASVHHLDRILPEVKGADLRRNICLGNRDRRRHALGFLDKVLELLEKYDVKLVARIWVKALGLPFDGKAVYGSSIQSISSTLDWLLVSVDEPGVVILDSRTKGLNVPVAHSIFTQKFQSATSFYSGLVDLPTFGHSDNHAGLQLCDLVSSAILYPIACYTYCTGYVANVHVQSTATRIKLAFGHRVQKLQFRYQEPIGRWKGGVVVSDRLGQKHTREMFS